MLLVILVNLPRVFDTSESEPLGKSNAFRNRHVIGRGRAAAQSMRICIRPTAPRGKWARGW